MILMILIAEKQVNTSVSTDGLTVGTLGIPSLRTHVQERSLITGKNRQTILL